MRKVLPFWAGNGNLSRYFRDRYQVFGAREDKGVFPVVVDRNALGGFPTYTRDAQTPAESKWAIPIARGIYQAELRLKPVSTRGTLIGTVKLPVPV